MKQDILELRQQDYCCSQIIMELGLRKLDKENPDLITAMAGLCGDVGHGLNCGILLSAVCLLKLADPDASYSNVMDLIAWFEDAFESIDCNKLLGDNPLQGRVEKCPMMLEATFTKVCELLEWD